MPVVVRKNETPDPQLLRGASHRRERRQRGQLMPERFLDEVISKQERGIAGIFGPSRGFEQGAARPRVFPEHSEPKRPRARHYRRLVRLPRRISATGRARSRAGGLALAEAVDDRRAPVAAKGAGRDLDADRSLAALVLVCG